MPPTSIDGNEITGATIDGQEVSEITVDGDVVFTAGPDIPDSGDLYARYAADELSLSDGDIVSTWPDETGNGHDLTAPSGQEPTYVASGFNDNPVVRFDPANSEFMDVVFSEQAQPNTIFMAFQLQNTNDSNDDFAYDAEANVNGHLLNLNRNGDFGIYAGASYVKGNARDTNAHILSDLFASTAIHRRDGTQTASGSIGSSGLDGFTLGSSANQFDHAPIDVTELLIYPQDKSGIFSDVEQYLSVETGIEV